MERGYERYERGFWGTGNVLFIGLCADYIGVFILRILQVAHLLLIYFPVCCSSIKSLPKSLDIEYV